MLPMGGSRYVDRSARVRVEDFGLADERCLQATHAQGGYGKRADHGRAAGDDGQCAVAYALGHATCRYELLKRFSFRHEGAVGAAVDDYS